MQAATHSIERLLYIGRFFGHLLCERAECPRVDTLVLRIMKEADNAPGRFDEKFKHQDSFNPKVTLN